MPFKGRRDFGKSRQTSRPRYPFSCMSCDAWTRESVIIVAQIGKTQKSFFVSAVQNSPWCIHVPTHTCVFSALTIYRTTRHLEAWLQIDSVMFCFAVQLLMHCLTKEWLSPLRGGGKLAVLWMIIYLLICLSVDSRGGNFWDMILS